MELINKNEVLRAKLSQKAPGKVVGLVPTMGALHKGHLSLIEKAAGEVDVIVVSIFVNPTQFNNKNDLQNYPKDLKTDIKILNTVKCDFVFAPEVKEIYPESDLRVFNFGYLEKIMEGKYRPGHFNGVAQVVSRLFEIISPDKAYFGEKDFQQLAIIKCLTHKLNLNIRIVSCPTVREIDGLAMSSRNKRLTVNQRNNATLIFKTLLQSKNFRNNYSVQELKDWVIDTINKNSYLDVEYFDIVDDVKLKSIKNWEEKNNKIGCIAVFCGDVRLIDNISYN